LEYLTAFPGLIDSPAARAYDNLPWIIPHRVMKCLSPEIKALNQSNTLRMQLNPLFRYMKGKTIISAGDYYAQVIILKIVFL
jgi:hypothetical protein